MVESTYPDGMDCVWLAADRNGHVGAFVTAGAGPIPLQWLDGEGVQLEDVETLVCNLSHVSQARMLVTMKKPDDFIELASRGVFVYDWQDIHRTSKLSTRTYEPVAIPLTPITVEGLTGNLANKVKTLVFANVAFADGEPLTVSKHTNCLCH